MKAKTKTRQPRVLTQSQVKFAAKTLALFALAGDKKFNAARLTQVIGVVFALGVQAGGGKVEP